MSRYVCIHGHFYQPPRENPWLEEIELQDTAHPYHDWNERITAEAYAPNTAARILDEDGAIGAIVNNYARMSFNFGPTLLSWMQRHEPEAYSLLLQADAQSRERFSGHGSAMAQAYNHMILPLAQLRDKQTQILWGIRDFECRFGRRPEGMWLPETAVDLESLDLMAVEGIRFTILAPRQAQAVRRINGRRWVDVSGERIDPRRAYQCRLPSGRRIALFFYDGAISQDIAFGNLLSDGARFAGRLTEAFGESPVPQLVHIATDGETYGHHHNMGDMALAYCLNHLDAAAPFRVTNYAEFLELHLPAHEVRIFENSSWSCVHGVERWRSDCGCCSGSRPDWHQQWRGPLRAALDRLREHLAVQFERLGGPLFHDVWQARNDYIDVILDRSDAAVRAFFSAHAQRDLNAAERITALKLLEIQRHAMLMYTSCGWFFDEVSGLETSQILAYAGRAVQLAAELGDDRLEEAFLRDLRPAAGNVPQTPDAAAVYEKVIRPMMLDFRRVGSHYAISSLFSEDREDPAAIYCYEVTRREYERLDAGSSRLCLGRADIRSRITSEERLVSFAVLYLGQADLVAGVQEDAEARDRSSWRRIRESFRKGEPGETLTALQDHFGPQRYSLSHLFKDEQSKILYQILDATLEPVHTSLREINAYHAPILGVIKQLNIPVPKVLSHTVLAMVNADLLQALAVPGPDLDRLAELVEEVRRWHLEIDLEAVEFMARRRLTGLMRAAAQGPPELDLIERPRRLIDLLAPLGPRIDLWQAQNLYFAMCARQAGEMEAQARQGHRPAAAWLESFRRLGRRLNVRAFVPQGTPAPSI